MKNVAEVEIDIAVLGQVMVGHEVTIMAGKNAFRLRRAPLLSNEDAQNLELGRSLRKIVSSKV